MEPGYLTASTREMRFAHFQFDPENDRLGEGPLSEVYRAVDTNLNRTVALKILRAHAEIDPQADRRFRREAIHASNLDHPNIATIYEYGQDQGTSFIAMEFLQGRTLDKVIKDQTLGYEECLRIALQVTDALAQVHRHNLIHRDLKPGNILLQDDGSTKLLDFGIARARDEATITQHGMLVGTVLYMSPEQVRGEDLDFRSDIFSLGAVLYHVMTGALPFPGESFPEVCMAILEGSPRLPSKVRSGFPPALQDMLLRCLRTNPDERFQEAVAAHGALLSIADKLTGTRTHAQARLKGRILLPPLGCGTGDDVCQRVAGGIRKDLAGELARNKGVQVALIEDAVPPDDARFDCIVRGRLDVQGHTGRLGMSVELYDAGSSRNAKPLQVIEDVCQHTDDDEWTLQADLVRSAMRALRRALTQASARPIAALQGRNVGEALKHATLALDVMQKATTKHLLMAITNLRHARELDRYCALAYAGMGEALVRKYLYWDGDSTFLDEARDYCGRALTLDSGCARAHTSLGFANHVSGHSADAQREYRLAIQVDNGEWFAHRLLGALLAREGNFKNASPLLLRAIGLKPEHIASYDHLYNVLQRLDRYEEALEVAEKGIAAAHKHLGKVPDDQNARLHMATLQARMGLQDDARAQIEAARARAPKDGYTAFHCATAFALMGEVDEALDALTRAQARGYYVKSELLRNPDFDVLRGMPAFEDLAQ